MIVGVGTDLVRIDRLAAALALILVLLARRRAHRLRG